MKHLLLHLDDEEYRELSQVKDRRGLTWKALLLSIIRDGDSIKSKDDKKRLDKRKDGRRNHADFITPSGSSQVLDSSSFPVEDPAPNKTCQRCGGKPRYNKILEEWECESCGHILRLKP